MSAKGASGVGDLPDSMSRLKLTEELLGNIELPGPPPKDFNPLSASDDDLLNYGLPPRPDKASCPEQYDEWEQLLSQPLTLVPSTLKILDQSPVPVPVQSTPGQTEKANRQSGHWSGAVNNDLEEGYKFKIVSASWTVSRPYPQNWAWTTSGWKSGNFRAGTWVGIDGYHTSHDVLQAGTAQRCVTSNGGDMKVVTFPWIEWYPAHVVEISGFEVNPGDLVTVQVGAFDLSPSGPVTRGFVFFCNRSACTYFSAVIKAPDGISLQGDTAEWIVECHKPEDGEPTMSYLGATFFYKCWAIAENKKNKIRRVVKKDLSGAILIDIVQDGVTLSRAERENNSVLGIFGEQRTNSTKVGKLDE